MSASDGNSRLLKNSAWNTSAFLLGVGLNLIILPFILVKLGAAAFGVAGLVTACIAPAQTFSNSLALSATRELARRLAPSQHADARHLFATALMLAGVGGVFIALVLALLGPLLAVRVFHLDGKLAGDLPLAFAFGAGGWFCQCISVVLVAVFTARQDYARVASNSMVSVVVSVLAMLALIPASPLASTFLGCQALGFAAGLVASFLLARQAAGEWLARPALHRASLMGLMSLGSWQFAAQAGGLIANQVDRYLLGAFLAPQFVGYYTIAQRLEEAIYIGILKIGETLFPFFSSLQKESSERVADLLFRSSWVLNVLAACILGALIPLAGPLLQVWTGREVAVETQGLLVVLSSAGILGCASNVFAYYLLADGRSRTIASIALVTAIATVSASAVALPVFGWRGAGWSACFGMVAQITLTTILMRRIFNLEDIWHRLAHFVFQPLATGIVSAIALRHFVSDRLFAQATNWWVVGLCYGLAAAIIFVAVISISAVGPYGATCRKDLRMIAGRLMPGKAV
jgi:O-antigen/teichoic acid export membrane protein